MRFPIIPNRERDVTIEPHPMTVSWSVAGLAYSVYSARHGDEQSLERMAERGGFHAAEMDMFLPDWRDREAADRLDVLMSERDEAERLLHQCYTHGPDAEITDFLADIALKRPIHKRSSS